MICTFSSDVFSFISFWSEPHVWKLWMHLYNCKRYIWQFELYLMNYVSLYEVNLGRTWIWRRYSCWRMEQVYSICSTLCNPATCLLLYLAFRHSQCVSLHITDSSFSSATNKKVLLGLGGGHYVPRHMDVIK